MALSAATQYAKPSEFGGKCGTECLNIRFPLPTLLCAGYRQKLIIVNTSPAGRARSRRARRATRGGAAPPRTRRCAAPTRATAPTTATTEHAGTIPQLRDLFAHTFLVITSIFYSLLIVIRKLESIIHILLYRYTCQIALKI